ncbi:MAG TPA: endolytic transglycosylase MltG [Candidatus Acidoferrales bacterium]|nr:endolytic transglycosylase MltG [Candidatus Acidoferrales bacterium]
MQDYARRKSVKNNSMKKFFFLIILLILLLGGIGAWWINGITPANSIDTKTQTFEVSKGEDVRMIANNLKAQGLIKDPIIFYLLVKQKAIGSKIQAGEFQLSPSMSAGKIADVLQLATDDVRITIPEGKRAEEIAQILRTHFTNYQSSWEQQLVANEGYLFPDTYAFSKDTDINTIITTMKGNFDKKYASIPSDGKSGFSKAQIVTIASMVEREARFAEDRPLIASVIYNRLADGMPLQIDATIQYAIGDQNNWWPTLTNSGGNIAPTSPYNTYTNTGLPPTPIANPGVAAIQAAMHPAQTTYLFYITDPSGHNHYATTTEEHDANIKKYGLSQ